MPPDSKGSRRRVDGETAQAQAVRRAAHWHKKTPLAVDAKGVEGAAFSV